MENKTVRICNPDIRQMYEDSKKDIEAQNRMKDFLEKIEKGDIILPDDKELRKFPWEHVLDCKDYILSPKYSQFILGFPCLNCSNDLIWIYFRSPAWTWRELCGREGFLAICPHCVGQVRYIPLTMS